MAQLPPEDVATMPTQKVVFNAPFDNKATYYMRVINPGTKRIGYAFKTTKPKRINIAERSARPKGVRQRGRLLRRLRPRQRGHQGRLCDRGVDQHAGPSRHRVRARVVPGRRLSPPPGGARAGAPQELADRVQRLMEGCFVTSTWT
ncbi:hypothetical protein niasHT_021061 [Heterodera trifolii]|uniref:Major sperm protein n=1 Tax=Heterodera trifolii TaxID=157864 RepID=A0ABD2KD73_9BILA